jgi:hypothetical protein
VINVVDPPVANTATPTPTPTPTPRPCVGDCNGDMVVTIGDLLTMVNIALGRASISICPQGDASGDNHITVDELLAAVNDALEGCPIAQGLERSPLTTIAAIAQCPERRVLARHQPG